MNIAIISFSSQGTRLAMEIGDILEGMGNRVKAGYKGKFIVREMDGNKEKTPSLPIKETLSKWTEQSFQEMDGIIFVGAMGIAVRAIAPYIKHKAKDPAVIVVDETGEFVIPVLSGHIGGANRLARQVSEKIGGVQVITTATDRNGKFAVDEWAVEQGMTIVDLPIAKEVSAAILAGIPVGLASKIPVTWPIPEGLRLVATTYKSLTQGEPLLNEDSAEDNRELGIHIWDGKEPLLQIFTRQLTLIPPSLFVGVGCRRGTSEEKIHKAVMKILRNEGWSLEAVKSLASIDIKKDEEGLLDFSREVKKPIVFFSAVELSNVVGDFTPSEFVKTITGVDNVCERSALMATSGRGKLIVRKTAMDGVTVAIARIHREVKFEKNLLEG